MSGTTSVPTISFTANGFVVPAQADIVTGLEADWNAAFNGNLDFAIPSTPQSQLTVSQGAILGDMDDQLVLLFNSVDPAYAFGRMQDAIARIYFLERLPAQSTILEIACTGLAGVIIPIGALVVDSSGVIYFCTGQITLRRMEQALLHSLHKLPVPHQFPPLYRFIKQFLDGIRLRYHPAQSAIQSKVVQHLKRGVKRLLPQTVLGSYRQFVVSCLKSPECSMHT